MTVMNSRAAKYAKVMWLDSASSLFPNRVHPRWTAVSGNARDSAEVDMARAQQPSCRKSSLPICERYHSTILRSRFVDRLLLAILALLCTQGFVSVPNAAPQSLSDQVSEL